jgi:hypothetical protein
MGVNRKGFCQSKAKGLIDLRSKAMRKLKAGLFSFVWACFLFTGSAEALRLKTNWAKRVDLSEKIVQGQVVLVKSQWNQERTLIYTDVTLLIDDHIKKGVIRGSDVSDNYFTIEP